MHPYPIALQNRMCYTVRKTSCTCNHMFVCTTIEKGLIRRNGKSSAQDNQDRPAAAFCIAARPYVPHLLANRQTFFQYVPTFTSYRSHMSTYVRLERTSGIIIHRLECFLCSSMENLSA